MVTWGREHFAPVQYTGLDVGPFSITVRTREGESARMAAQRGMATLDLVARQEFERKTREFLQRLKQADKIASGAA